MGNMPREMDTSNGRPHIGWSPISLSLGVPDLNSLTPGTRGSEGESSMCQAERVVKTSLWQLQLLYITYVLVVAPGWRSGQNKRLMERSLKKLSY